MIKRLVIYLFLLTAFYANAEQTRFTMSAPKAVEMGKQFRLTFSLNERGRNLKLPLGISSNFNVLMGPSTGQSTSISTINGRTTTTVNYSYTYILSAKKEGSFEIRPASIEVKGKVFESNAIKIQVVKAQSRPAQSQNNQQKASNKPVDLGTENLFARVELSKQNVYRGEQILATVKLYVNPNVNLAGFDQIDLPTYEGFYTQDIDIPQQINLTREVYNNKIYQVGVLKKTILFPQQNGKIKIEPFKLSLIIQQRIKARSFFDDFFSNYRNVKAAVTGKGATVNVKDLPAPPAGFLGGVGNFNISSSISSENVTTNDAVTLTVNIKGTGNIRLVRSPELKLPTDFEVYDPRPNDNVKATDAGVSGTKTIEYLFQPRFEGDYKIPAIKFTYFNPTTGKYVSKTTDNYVLHVKKGAEEQSTTVVSSLRKEDVQLIGQDIRFIKTGEPQLQLKGHTFFASTTFYLGYLVSLLVFIIMFVVYRKKVKENANLALVRNKKANRVASKRLKAAAAFMKQNNNEAFYEAILKAFWGYLSDKLGIPVADLNRESAITELNNRKVDKEVISNFEEVIEQSEFAQYAPASGSEARSELYKKAASTISRFEKQIKK